MVTSFKGNQEELKEASLPIEQRLALESVEKLKDEDTDNCKGQLGNLQFSFFYV